MPGARQQHLIVVLRPVERRRHASRPTAARRPLRSRAVRLHFALFNTQPRKQVQDPGGAFGQADNAIGVARARLAAVLHAQTLCSALSNVNTRYAYLLRDSAGHSFTLRGLYASFVCRRMT